MVGLFFEIYGAFCFFSLAAFLVWAAVAKLRPDLDEESAEIEKLRKLVRSGVPGDALSKALSIEAAIMEELAQSAIEELPRSSPARLGKKQSKRLIRRVPHLFHARKPRLT